ncbi:hypothetical protein MMC08_006879 [Hypocenomyce scalaris]|nr:hypothetical protein [Hypocenomyce scalaris]
MQTYGNRQTGQPFMSQQGSFAPMARPMYPQPNGSFDDFSRATMMTSTPAYGGGFYQDAHGNLQPLTSQAPPLDAMDPQSQQMVQSYADALLYQNEGQMGAVKQEAGSSSAEAGQPNQATPSNAPQDASRPAASAAPPTATPPVTAAQQQVEAR